MSLASDRGVLSLEKQKADGFLSPPAP